MVICFAEPETQSALDLAGALSDELAMGRIEKLTRGEQTVDRTILIVDDSLTMLTNIRLTLESNGYKTAQARDGVEALATAKTLGRVDAVLTDLNMPNMDGIRLIQELRSLAAFRFTPIIMLTTESQADKKEQGRRAGATGWIVKPFQPEQLLAVLKKVIK